MGAGGMLPEISKSAPVLVCLFDLLCILHAGRYSWPLLLALAKYLSCLDWMATIF